MDAFIKFERQHNTIIEAKLYNENDELIIEPKLEIDLDKKIISNYKDFFVEIVENSFLNNLKYNIIISDEDELLEEDYQKIKNLLSDSISAYDSITI